jgi:hypothetical protein
MQRPKQTVSLEVPNMASNTSKGILRVVVLLLGPILKAVTPAIKGELASFLKKLDAKAEATPNPIDDLFTGFLLDIFEVE